VRAAASIDLSKTHDMSETDIAKKLDIAQAAVSKYLSGNYSASVKRLVSVVQEKRLQEPVVLAILSGKDDEKIADLIDVAASNKDLIEIALRP